MRSLLLLGIALQFLNPATAGQPPIWLSEVAVPDSTKTISHPNLSEVPKLNGLEELGAYQKRVLKDWTEFLGTFDRSLPSNFEFQWLETVEHEPGLTRSLIEYETEPGQRSQAFVLRPTNLSKDQKVPAVVVFHSTVENSIYQPVGLTGPSTDRQASEEELRKAFALHLARRGYVTLSPRNYLWPRNLGISAKGEADSFNQRHPNRKGMARMLLDGQRAIDVLCALDGVDPKQIGAIGHSLGAKEVLYLAAFDSRIKASVSSEGGLGIQQSNWDAPWYLSSQCLDPGFKLNHHQLLAAIAPRAFLLIGGDASDGSSSLPYLEQAKVAFLAAHSSHSLGFYNHQQGHQVTQTSLQRSLDWLDWQLKQ